MKIGINYAVVRDDGKFIKSIGYDPCYKRSIISVVVKWTSQLEFAKLWVAKTAAHDDMPEDEGMKVVKVRTELSMVWSPNIS